MPKPSKSSVRKPVLQHDPERRTAEVAGYEVAYCSFPSLRHQFDEIFVRQVYRFTTPNPCPFIVDCGSNIGMSVLYFRSLCPGAEILAFEPDPDAFACLERNLRVHRLEKVTAENRALSKEPGTVEIFYDPDDPGALRTSAIRERMPKRSRTVRAVTLSSYVVRPVDFLKLDVEGVETDVLEDLRDHDRLRLVDQMAIEYHHHIHGDVDAMGSMLRLLEESNFGYQCEARLQRPLRGGKFQDILIYAYRKSAS